jgi:pimeloyl-ACP methyl ester carboxylesterase
MSNLIVASASAHDGAVLARSPTLERMPFFSESRGEALFSWLHRINQISSRRDGIIICPPVGYEQIHSHRSLSHLADAIAMKGLPVVRFDYHGTGDSAGRDEDPERYGRWLDSIRDMATWMRGELGCRQISLVGLRLGAALAAKVAESQAVDGLVLWAPVSKGRNYVREMKALSLTAAPLGGEADGALESAGFTMTEETARALQQLDLLALHPLCRRALIVERDDGADDNRLCNHFANLGIAVEQIRQPGYADMMAEPHFGKVPQQAIRHMAEWLAEGVNEGECDRSVEVARTAGKEETIPLRQAITSVSQEKRLFRTEVVCIREGPELFGIMSEPCEPSAASLPVIVMVNAGSANRVGPNRLYVGLARQLNDAGFRCLRLDLSGLGDSVCPEAERENDPYPATAFRDIERTLRHLQTRLGVERVVLLGLCSGAYAAFQAAAQLTSPVLVESVLINPLTFYWREGMSLSDSPELKQLQSFHDCKTSLRQPSKWLKVLSGRSKTGIGGALRILRDSWRLRRRSERTAEVKGMREVQDALPSHPFRDDLPGDLERIEKAGRQLACFFARSDPGYSLLTLYAKRKVDALCRAGKMGVFFIENADHTFSRRAARRDLGEALTGYLTRRYHPAPEATLRTDRWDR